MKIIEQFRKQGAKIAVGLALAGGVVGLTVNDRAAVVIEFVAAAVGIFKLTDDYLKQRSKDNAPGRPVVHSEEIEAIRRERMQIREELGIGVAKKDHG